MSWFVVVPAVWFGIALALGLLVGRCLHVEGIARAAATAPAGGAATPAATDVRSAGDGDSHSALSTDHALARTV
jgi:hypothetical protein